MVLKAIRVLQHFKNYVSTSVKSAKEIFFSIFIALNPKWVPRYIIVLCRLVIKGSKFYSTLKKYIV